MPPEAQQHEDQEQGSWTEKPPGSGGVSHAQEVENREHKRENAACQEDA